MAWKNDQVSGVETEKILELARKCLSVEGDFVELGVIREIRRYCWLVC